MTSRRHFILVVCWLCCLACVSCHGHLLHTYVYVDVGYFCIIINDHKRGGNQRCQDIVHVVDTPTVDDDLSIMHAQIQIYILDKNIKGAEVYMYIYHRTLVTPLMLSMYIKHISL